MMTSDIWSVNGISSQKPRPHASIDLSGCRRRDRQGGADDEERADEREDEGVGNPALGPLGERQGEAGEEFGWFFPLANRFPDDGLRHALHNTSRVTAAAQVEPRAYLTTQVAYTTTLTTPRFVDVLLRSSTTQLSVAPVFPFPDTTSGA